VLNNGSYEGDVFTTEISEDTEEGLILREERTSFPAPVIPGEAYQ